MFSVSVLPGLCVVFKFSVCFAFLSRSHRGFRCFCYFVVASLSHSHISTQINDAFKTCTIDKPSWKINAAVENGGADFGESGAVVVRERRSR